MLWRLVKPDPNPKPFDPVAYRMKFKARLAAFVFAAIVSILVLLIMQPGNAYDELVKSIVQFLLGGVIGSIITFYFDGNESSQPPVPPEQFIKSGEPGPNLTFPSYTIKQLNKKSAKDGNVTEE